MLFHCRSGRNGQSLRFLYRNLLIYLTWRLWNKQHQVEDKKRRRRFFSPLLLKLKLILWPTVWKSSPRVVLTRRSSGRLEDTEGGKCSPLSTDDKPNERSAKGRNQPVSEGVPAIKKIHLKTLHSPFKQYERKNFQKMKNYHLKKSLEKYCSRTFDWNCF